MKHFSMFSGIGGFELGIQRAIKDAECVGFSEVDKYAISIYQRHFPEHKAYGDATRIVPESIPDFDLLCGGFPCQAFSIAGKRGGFEDTRGTLFHEIARIARAKRPKLLFLENVKGLLSHDHGRTFGTILSTFSDLGYFLEWQVLNSKDFGVPQNRERVFIVGHLGGGGRSGKVFPIFTDSREDNSILNGEGEIASTVISTYARNQSDGQYVKVATLRTHKDGQGFREVESGLAPCIPARAREDGSGQPVVAIPVLTPDRLEKRQNGRRFKEDGEPSFTVTAQDKHGVYDGMRIRRLTPKECERLQSFPDDWTKFDKDGKQVSDSQRYKVLGNAVTVNVIEAIAGRMKRGEV